MSRWQSFDLLTGRIGGLQFAGVYAIFFDDELMYVGSSVNLASRLAAHRFRYGWKRNIVTPWDTNVPDRTRVSVRIKGSERLGDWAMWEIRLIARLRPKCNTVHIKRLAA